MPSVNTWLQKANQMPTHIIIICHIKQISYQNQNSKQKQNHPSPPSP